MTAPIVLVPGLAGLPEHDFAFLGPMLARGRDVLPVDLTTVPATAAGLDRAIGTAVERAGGRVVLVGVSIGAVAAVRFTAAHPDAAESLVAIAGWLTPAPTLRAFARTWATLRREGSAALADVAGAHLTAPADEDRIRGLPATPATDALVALAAALPAIGADRVRAAALVVGGTDDRLAPDAALLAAALPDARYAELPTGHDVLAARPAQVLRLVQAHLAAPAGAPLPALQP